MRTNRRDSDSSKPAVPPDPLAMLLARYPAGVQDLARAACSLIQITLEDADETVDSAAGVIGYGRGTGYSGLWCTVILSKKGIKIGLPGSASWPNPRGLLEGTGKRHRYVACSTLAELERPGIMELIQHARRAH